MFMVLVYLRLESKSWEEKKWAEEEHREVWDRGIPIILSHISNQTVWGIKQIWGQMAVAEVEELMVHLERNIDLSTMEQGVKLVGIVLVNKTLNKWGVRNILRSSWKKWAEVEVKWVKDNTFIITVQDESTATQILNQVSWAVMKQNFLVKRWAQELALEEINMNIVFFLYTNQGCSALS